MDGASKSQQKQKLTPLEQLASAFCAIDQSKISYIDFELAERDIDEPQSSSHIHQLAIHSSSDQKVIPSSSTNQTKDTLLSIVNPHLWRNNQQGHGFIQKSNAKSYWSKQGSLLSLDHSKLLAEASRNSKVSLCSPQPDEQRSSNFSRISGTCGGSVCSGEKSSNNKKRLKWTADLHEKFVNCVNLLGGAEKATTPKAILKLMKSEGLTVFHVKSHLQKYRFAKMHYRFHPSGMKAKEVLQMQLQVQRHLCEQLEIQQNLQQAIEAQGKQIQMMLEQLKKTNKASSYNSELRYQSPTII